MMDGSLFLHFSDLNEWIWRADHSTLELVVCILTVKGYSPSISAAPGQKLLTYVQKQ